MLDVNWYHILVPESGASRYQDSEPDSVYLWGCPAHGKNNQKVHQQGSGWFFTLLSRTLSKMWAGRILILIMSLHFYWNPDFQIPRFSDFQIYRLPDFQSPATTDELSDPNVTSLPMHRGIKYVARTPCCDLWKTVHHLLFWIDVISKRRKPFCCAFTPGCRP